MEFGRKGEPEETEHILSRQGSSLFSNQSSKGRGEGEVEVVGETERRGGTAKKQRGLARLHSSQLCIQMRFISSALTFRTVNKSLFSTSDSLSLDEPRLP